MYKERLISNIFVAFIKSLKKELIFLSNSMRKPRPFLEEVSIKVPG